MRASQNRRKKTTQKTVPVSLIMTKTFIVRKPSYLPTGRRSDWVGRSRFASTNVSSQPVGTGVDGRTVSLEHFESSPKARDATVTITVWKRKCKTFENLFNPYPRGNCVCVCVLGAEDGDAARAKNKTGPNSPVPPANECRCVFSLAWPVAVTAAQSGTVECGWPFGRDCKDEPFSSGSSRDAKGEQPVKGWRGRARGGWAEGRDNGRMVTSKERAGLYGIRGGDSSRTQRAADDDRWRAEGRRRKKNGCLGFGYRPPQPAPCPNVCLFWLFAFFISSRFVFFSPSSRDPSFLGSR